MEAYELLVSFIDSTQLATEFKCMVGFFNIAYIATEVKNKIWPLSGQF